MKVSFRPDADVVAFLKEEISLDLTGQNLDNEDRWLFVVVRNEHDAVVGVMVFEAKTWFDWHLSVAIVDYRCFLMAKLNRLIWRTVFEKAVRVTMHIDPANAASERQARKLGAVYEGFLRRGLDGSRDALVYGMLREDCRWLNARQRPAQPPRIENSRQPSLLN